MALATATEARTKKLSDLGLRYPVWVFDVDQHAWPRKSSETSSAMRPAKLVGWSPWPWEYGTTLRRKGDALPHGVTIMEESKSSTTITDLLNQLRYDDSFDHSAFRIVYDAGKGTAAKSLADWIFEPERAGFVSPRRIKRIERCWDEVCFWERETKGNLFASAQQTTYTSYGVTQLVHDDAELLQVTRVAATHSAEEIRKASIRLLDQDEEEVQGIVFPHRSQDSRGIILPRGPDFAPNKLVLADTPLAVASWSEVEDYVMGRRAKPLVQTEFR